jgi:hypothetical protein
MCEELQHDVTALGGYPQPFKKVAESDICCVIAFALIQPKQLVRAEDVRTKRLLHKAGVPRE